MCECGSENKRLAIDNRTLLSIQRPGGYRRSVHRESWVLRRDVNGQENWSILCGFFSGLVINKSDLTIFFVLIPSFAFASLTALAITLRAADDK